MLAVFACTVNMNYRMDACCNKAAIPRKLIRKNFTNNLSTKVYTLEIIKPTVRIYAFQSIVLNWYDYTYPLKSHQYDC